MSITMAIGKCDYCRKDFQGVVQEREEKGIVEQFITCPKCSSTHTIIFYDELLDSLVLELNEASKTLDEDNIEIINYKKRIKNLANFLKKEAIRRTNDRGCYIRLPEELHFLLD